MGLHAAIQLENLIARALVDLQRVVELLGVSSDALQIPTFIVAVDALDFDLRVRLLVISQVLPCQEQ